MFSTIEWFDISDIYPPKFMVVITNEGLAYWDGDYWHKGNFYTTRYPGTYFSIFHSGKIFIRHWAKLPHPPV